MRGAKWGKVRIKVLELISSNGGSTITEIAESLSESEVVVMLLMLSLAEKGFVVWRNDGLSNKA